MSFPSRMSFPVESESGTVMADFKYAPPADVGAFYAFEDTLDRAVVVYTTLERARESYEGGRASYANAAEEVSQLVEEANKSAARLVEACIAVDRFFDPETQPSEAFKGNGNAFLKFCRQFIDTVKPGAKTLGNSGRGSSGRSRRVPPATARSAKPSSSKGPDSPAGRGSEPGKQ